MEKENEKLTPEVDTQGENQLADELEDKDLDLENIEIHMNEESADVSSVEGDYGAEQIQILKAWRLYANGRACTSAAPRNGACIIWSTR